MATNITRRTQLEPTLRERPDILAGIIGSAMEAIIATDEAQRIVLFNSAAEDMFGCKAEEVIGDPIGRFIPASRAEYDKLVRRFGRGGGTHRKMGTLDTLWGLRANGEEFPLEASISKVESRGTTVLAAVIRDITDRYKTEQSVRESEERFRLVADTAPVLIWMSGTDKLCIYFNKPWLDFTGRSIEQELGDGWAENVHPADLQKCLETYTQSFDRREKFRMEYRLRHHDGEYRWILDIGVPRFDQARSFAGYIGVGVDVTEHKQAEKALRESEERFRLAAQAGKTYAYEWDVATDQVVRSANISSVLGPTQGTLLTRQQLMGRVHPDDQAMFDASVSERTPEHPDVQVSYRLLHPDGSVVWLEKTAHASFDERGKMVRMIGMVANISERKRAEQALRESEERLRLAIQAGKMYAYEWDLKSDVLVRSPEFVSVLGATEPQTLTHQQAMRKIHPDDRPKLVAAVAKHSPENPTVTVAYRVLLPGTSPIWVKSSGRAFFDGEGKIVRVVGIVADVTDQKLVEEALRASEERLRLAQKVAGIGTFERNIRTGVNTWTPEMESMYGLSPGHFEQTRAAFEKLIHPDDRAEVTKLVDGALETGQPTSGEWRVVWPDGSVHWIAGRWQVLVDESGEPSRVVGVDMDITERKQAEEALSGMTRRLVEALEQERARIARELHDDVNQRLGLMAMALEQLRINPARVRSRVQELQTQITEISNDIQGLAHDLHSSKLEYLGVAAAVKSWCKDFAKRHKMEIDCRDDIASALPTEIGLCLFRVLQEALHNAAKHSGVKQIDVQLLEESGEIHLIVRDSGKGFDVEALEQGKGLGFTSMRERVRLVNGTITIASKPMRGTTIHVCVVIDHP